MEPHVCHHHYKQGERIDSARNVENVENPGCGRFGAQEYGSDASLAVSCDEAWSTSRHE